MLHRTIIGIVLIMLGSVNAPLQAQVALPNSPTAVELAALPRECRSKVLGRASPQLEAEWNLYEARHGREVWLHYHHYCFALNFMNRTPLARRAITPAAKHAASSAASVTTKSNAKPVAESNGIHGAMIS